MLHIKRYIIAAIVLLALIGGYYYYMSDGMVSMSVFGAYTSYPLAIWSMIPATLLLFFTLLHLWYHGAKLFFLHKRFHKDYENIIDKVFTNSTGKAFKGSFKNEDFRQLAEVIDRFSMLPRSASNESGVEKIDGLFKDIESIEKGEYVEPKSFPFSNSSPYYLMNQKNRIKNDEKYLLEVLKKEDDVELFGYAYDSAMDKNMEKEIKAYYHKLQPSDKTRASKMLESFFTADKKLFSLDELAKFLKHFDFNSGDYIELARKLKPTMTPDELLKLFESLVSDKHEAEDGYIYTLFDLEMVDDAEVRLQNASEANAKKFEAYALLKKEGKQIALDMFF